MLGRFVPVGGLAAGILSASYCANVEAGLSVMLVAAAGESVAATANTLTSCKLNWTV